VPTDFSEVANLAVNYAVKLAEKNHAKIILLTVITDLPATDEEMMMLRVNLDSVKAYNQRQIDAAKARLQNSFARLSRKLRAKFIVRDGKPFAEITQAAKDTSLI
jgi:nucleotide-binding universal stress UspA family protein